jgi:hypothetical protein
MVAVVAASIVTSRRALPADMLLLQARMGNTTAGAPASGDEILVAEEDELVDTGAQAPKSDDGAVVLWRPISEVHLGHITWSGPIDHFALQDALACRMSGPTPRGVALEVTLQASDLSVWNSLSSDGTDASVSVLGNALHLPERITGASSSTQHALNGVLCAYRRASFAYAWQVRFNAGLHQFERERDEAAVVLLSTLRAVLGER